MMDPIEIADWLAGQLTRTSSDAQEILAFKTGLPVNYPWVDGSELLEKKTTE
ncbi:MAG TPA: hypothetical protein VIY48_08240 [Candidatus Paceibacterota bacterium]